MCAIGSNAPALTSPAVAITIAGPVRRRCDFARPHRIPRVDRPAAESLLAFAEQASSDLDGLDRSALFAALERSDTDVHGFHRFGSSGVTPSAGEQRVCQPGPDRAPLCYSGGVALAGDDVARPAVALASVG